MKSAPFTLALLMLTLLTSLTLAQNAELNEEYDALRQQERQINDQLRNRHRELSGDESMQPLRQRMNAADEALRDRQNNDPEIIAAREARDEASRRLQKAVWEHANQSEDGQAIREQISTINTQLDKLEADRRRNQFEIREVERQIDDSPELRELHTARWQADQAFNDARRNNEALQVAENAYREARKALDEKIKTLPEYQAVEEARAAVELAKDSEAIRAAQAARDLANDRYNEKREALHDADPGLKSLRDQRRTLNEQHGNLHGQRRDSENKLRDLARTIERESPAVKPARDAASTARSQYDEVLKQRTATEQEARQAAHKAFHQRVNERFEDDDQATKLRDELEDTRRRMRITDLRKQINRLEAEEKSEASDDDSVNF